MKLTDKQLDRLFQDSASKQSFAYKPEYWEEFSAALSDSTPLSEASDDALDSAFQESAAKQSFEYKPEFWEEFSASLLDTNPLSEASDDALDAAFQTSAANQSFEYKSEFWEEFSASLPDNTPLSQVADSDLDAAFQKDASSISVDYKPEFWSEFSDELSSVASTENVSDTEVDAMYRDEASKLSFVYHPSYWEEMAAMLRRRRRRPEFLWFGLSGVFATTIVAMLLMQPSSISDIAPQFTFGKLNTAETNANSVASNGVHTSENNGVRNTNDVNNADIPSNANNASGTVLNGNSVNQNGNVVSANPLVVSNTPTIQSTVTPTTPIVVPSPNRAVPNPILATTPNQPVRNVAVNGTVNTNDKGNKEDAIELKPLTAKSMGTLTTLNSDLIDSYNEIPSIRPYKSGWQSSLYVQGISGASQFALSDERANGFVYGAGLGWQTQKNNWTINVGANVLLEDYNALNVIKDVKSYVGFGSIVERYDRNFKHLYRAELDLNVGYNFGRSQVRLGVRPSYIYNALLDYSLYTYDTSREVVIETNENQTNAFGHLNVLERFGIKPTFGYAYNMKGNWTLGVNLGVQLRPSLAADHMSSPNSAIPFDGQLYLRKTLNFKK